MEHPSGSDFAINRGKIQLCLMEKLRKHPFSSKHP
jgi:hypothetical protein